MSDDDPNVLELTTAQTGRGADAPFELDVTTSEGRP